MTFVAIVGIQILNLSLAFVLSPLAVSGQGEPGGIYLVQAISGVWIAMATAVALLLSRNGKPRSGLKVSMLTLPMLYLCVLLFLAASAKPTALASGLAVLGVGWGGILLMAKRRLCKFGPTTLSAVILSSKFNTLEWVGLLAVGFIAVCTWYQLLTGSN